MCANSLQLQFLHHNHYYSFIGSLEKETYIRGVSFRLKHQTSRKIIGGKYLEYLREKKSYTTTSLKTLRSFTRLRSSVRIISEIHFPKYCNIFDHSNGLQWCKDQEQVFKEAAHPDEVVNTSIIDVGLNLTLQGL